LFVPNQRRGQETCRRTTTRYESCRNARIHGDAHSCARSQLSHIVQQFGAAVSRTKLFPLCLIRLNAKILERVSVRIKMSLFDLFVSDGDRSRATLRTETRGTSVVRLALWARERDAERRDQESGYLHQLALLPMRLTGGVASRGRGAVFAVAVRC
jgi:hypothetical protein